MLIDIAYDMALLLKEKNAKSIKYCICKKNDTSNTVTPYSNPFDYPSLDTIMVKCQFGIQPRKK